MQLLTFIMPVKNVSPFIKDAICGIQCQTFHDWELIIVDDNSTDNTFKLAEEYAEKDKRIKVFHNNSIGKVQALNYGYSLANGDYIKCVDGDDVLLSSFSKNMEYITSSDASYHNCEIVDDKLQKVSIMNMGNFFINIDYYTCFRYMKSLPRWTWTFKKDIADLVFPMSNSLPFEDVWFSLMIKKYAKTIVYIKKPLYMYRQHSNQTFGGIFNFEKKVTIFRSRRMLNFLESIEKDGRLLTKDFTDLNSLLNPLRFYYKLAAQEELSFKSIITSGLSTREKAKLILLKKLPSIAPWILQQWLDKLRRY